MAVMKKNIIVILLHLLPLHLRLLRRQQQQQQQHSPQRSRWRHKINRHSQTLCSQRKMAIQSSIVFSQCRYAMTFSMKHQRVSSPSRFATTSPSTLSPTGLKKKHHNSRVQTRRSFEPIVRPQRSCQSTCGRQQTFILPIFSPLY